MKKYIHIIVLAMGLVAGACSNIDENDRLVYVAPAEAQRNVLIEDFTGQRCVNCPNATEEIHKMQEVYGDNVIAVAIHCGPFGGITQTHSGLKTETGEEYWNHWFSSTQGQPVAKINRGTSNGVYDSWAADVANALKVTTDVSITGEAHEADGTITINAKVGAKAGTKAKLQVWMTEDDIVNLQFMPNGKPSANYVHNHIFRAAVNGTWGEDIEFGESPASKEWTIAIHEDWKAANMNAVIFVYDDKEVRQVVSVKVK